MNKKEAVLQAIPIIQLAFTLDYDRDNFNWIRILDFPLRKRPGFPATTDILIKIPSRFPLTSVEHFFLDKNLSLGKHYHNDGWNELKNKGWSKYCLHINNWNPNQDTLLTIFECIKTILDRRSI